jgi:hypothetical protein
MAAVCRAGEHLAGGFDKRKGPAFDAGPFETASFQMLENMVEYIPDRGRKKLTPVNSRAILTAEQSRAEQSRAEQSRAEQSRAEQSRAEQSRAEQSRAEQSRAE